MHTCVSQVWAASNVFAACRHDSLPLVPEKTVMATCMNVRICTRPMNKFSPRDKQV